MADGQIDATSVETALTEFKDPETGRSAFSNGQFRDIRVTDNHLSLTLALTTWATPIWDDIQGKLEQTLRTKLPQLASLSIQRDNLDRPAQPIGEIGLTAKSVIAVGSGKGGVGKSTIAASLAIGLKRSGARVGLMDADVYGPSIPHLLGVSQRPRIVNEQIEPIFADGIPVMSMGFLVPQDEAVAWRGPMLHGAINQFLADTQWGDLDYLIIDMPPGTGDVALTLSQLLPLTGAIVVCTPQDVALIDAVRAITMFRRVNIPVLGMIENMSGFICPDCDKRYDIFGSGGARKRAERMDVPFLGDIPITMQYRELGDAGDIAANFSDPALAAPLERICKQLVTSLADAAANQPPQPELPVLG